MDCAEDCACEGSGSAHLGPLRAHPDTTKPVPVKNSVYVSRLNFPHHLRVEDIDPNPRRCLAVSARVSEPSFGEGQSATKVDRWAGTQRNTKGLRRRP